MALAYSLAMGFYSSLLAVLAFILLYSASTSRSLKEPLSKSLVFALGIVTGNAFLSVSLMTLGLNFYLDLFANLQTVTIVIAAIVILAGLFVSGVFSSLLGSAWFKEQSAAKYNLTLVALYFLGFLSFFVTVRDFQLSRFITVGTVIDVNLLLAFNLVLLAPFLAVGIISGALHKLARSTHEKHRLKIHALSGLVLILYALWLLWQIVA
jgi:cytochrome c biogenesis protein CcdA